jgi:xylulokinase
MSAFLGIDVGTYQSKGTLVAADGTVLATAVRSHAMLVPQPGWAEHRPEQDWWEELAAISRELLAVAGLPATAVKAVDVSAIGPCMLPLAADGRALMNAVLYGVDTRAAAEIEELSRRIGEERLLAVGASKLTSQSVGPKILWLRRHRPEIFAQAARVVTATSYLVARLTGEVVIDHYSAAGFTPLYDVRGRCWSDDLADGIIETARLPRLAETTEIVGTVTRAAAEATGLAPGTPVIAGTIDAAAEAFSVGVHAPGEMMLMYGSTSFTILVTATPVRDPRLWYQPWLMPGLHASAAGLATSGTLTHWFHEQLARELAEAGAIPALAREAAAIPAGAEGLVVLPYFSGERTPLHDPYAKGCFFGLTLAHTRGHLFRAVLEGIACGVRHLLSTYVEAGCAPGRVIAVGGGVRNPVWLQAVSDICGIEQVLPTHTIGASLGDAMLAAVAAAGISPAEVRAWNPAADAARPEPARQALYDRQFAVFRQLYDRTKDLMRELSPAADSNHHGGKP